MIFSSQNTLTEVPRVRRAVLTRGVTRGPLLPTFTLYFLYAQGRRATDTTATGTGNWGAVTRV